MLDTQIRLEEAKEKETNAAKEKELFQKKHLHLLNV